LKQQRKKRQHAALATVVGAQDENDVLDAYDENERPKHERENAIDVLRNGTQAVLLLETFAERIKRTCPDVAVDDPECYDCELSEAVPVVMGFGESADISDLSIERGAWTSILRTSQESQLPCLTPQGR
jgi:hypothetical protein